MKISTKRPEIKTVPPFEEMTFTLNREEVFLLAAIIGGIGGVLTPMEKLINPIWRAINLEIQKESGKYLTDSEEYEKATEICRGLHL